jgi:hypothetical protein
MMVKGATVVELIIVISLDTTPVDARRSEKLGDDGSEKVDLLR